MTTETEPSGVAPIETSVKFEVHAEERIDLVAYYRAMLPVDRASYVAARDSDGEAYEPWEWPATYPTTLDVGVDTSTLLRDLGLPDDLPDDLRSHVRVDTDVEEVTIARALTTPDPRRPGRSTVAHRGWTEADFAELVHLVPWLGTTRPDHPDTPDTPVTVAEEALATGQVEVRIDWDVRVDVVFDAVDLFTSWNEASRLGYWGVDLTGYEQWERPVQVITRHEPAVEGVTGRGVTVFVDVDATVRYPGRVTGRPEWSEADTKVLTARVAWMQAEARPTPEDLARIPGPLDLPLFGALTSVGAR